MKMTEYSSALLREHYYRMEHRSGLPIYVFPKALTTSYALFAVNYGSMDNAFSLSDGQPPVHVPDGIAHFLEHKLFENADGSDSFAHFAAIGADANAYTSYDRTAYLFSTTESFDDALEELLRFVTHPHFTDASIKKEQGIIAEEIRMYEDSPWERSFRILLESMYESCPVRINVCGSEESISKITPTLLYDCYRTFYNPTNMILAVCGDVTPEQIMAVADRALPADFLPRTVSRASFS
ncbi:MAG: insulinase family protein, partial [Clostridia bacterium]|nr:insulinase family protein [Clostridia bacterium]